MKLIKTVKAIIHVWAKNGELQYSYFATGDYQEYVVAKCKTENMLAKWNEEAGYKHYTCEITTLYGECQRWGD